MRKLYILLLLLFTGLAIQAQNKADKLPENPYATAFAEAYMNHPEMPRGILEAVAFTNTRFQHLNGSEAESCTGMPKAYTVMGLIADGKGWFRNNLAQVADLSGLKTESMLNNPQTAVRAFATAYDPLMIGSSLSEDILRSASFIASRLEQLSELPQASGKDAPQDFLQKRYAMDCYLYSVFSFLNDERCAAKYGFTQHNYDLKSLFGDDNYRVLSSGSVHISASGIQSREGNTYKSNSNSITVQSPDYGPALWNPAASCNYSSRNSVAISAVTIHTVQGTYAGCISWFQNCAASVSAHYVVRSSDGQVTQMVYESLKAWHVGSENPYTVGIEHEGYVNNPAWYTTAMYTSSAALTLDICNSNGIDPNRTGWYPWMATTYYNQSSIPGSCTKVKGHQHYPNQTHSDPGVNWNWEYFYQLINAAPAATVYTAASGNFYDSGGAGGNYADDERYVWTISPTNATSVTVTFTSYATENTWDYLFIYDGADVNAPLIGYYTGNNSPGTITSSGGSITFEFRSDCATTGTGWEANWSGSILVPPNPDVTSPGTQVSVNGTWQTQNFTASFTENDNVGGSGLEKSFYQVIDYDGADWRANNTQGFFSDNFDLGTIHLEWTSVTGTWAINNGALEQSDEGQTNTNIYAALTQNLSNKYLYHWAGKLDGTGSNRRAGFHFFCDNPTLPNRGNGYFVWFRIDQSALEFYKVTNDVFTLEQTVTMNTNIAQWYDWKVIYDRITGEIDLYRDNVFIGSWTDPSPYSTGDYISFRSGNSNWQIDNFKVYRSRFSNTPVTISVGNCPSCELRYQNTNPGTPAGRVKSIVRDTAYNLSAVAYQDINVDWTPPTSIDTINDGLSADIDLSTSATTLEANWSSSSDPHSGFSSYRYAIGTTPCDSDIVAWTGNWGYDTAVVNTLSLVNGQTYYFSVKAENGAGLVTPCYVSDGVYVDLTTGINPNTPGMNLQVTANPFDEETTILFGLAHESDIEITLTDMLGQLVYRSRETKAAGIHRQTIDPVSLSLGSGVYLLHVQAGNNSGTLKLIKR
ncbi:MAG: N-acetylmuramyl-L-alanine amidase, negative regulator of AmpC, AmpD [Bacteroidetes bacterium]|nr:MAG: N-acetylmuramyl-L-alanine amidase, negative regulator of AmpC, AmpD [Bacteroidota bacterium]